MRRRTCEQRRAAVGVLSTGSARAPTIPARARGLRGASAVPQQVRLPTALAAAAGLLKLPLRPCRSCASASAIFAIRPAHLERIGRNACVLVSGSSRRVCGGGLGGCTGRVQRTFFEAPRLAFSSIPPPSQHPFLLVFRARVTTKPARGYGRGRASPTTRPATRRRRLRRHRHRQGRHVTDRRR